MLNELRNGADTAADDRQPVAEGFCNRHRRVLHPDRREDQDVGARQEPVLPLAVDEAVEADAAIRAGKRLKPSLSVAATRDVNSESGPTRQADRPDEAIDPQG